MVKRVSAPVRKSVAVVGMAFFAALALLTNSLLWLNATTLRGTVSAADYRAIPLEAVGTDDALGLEPDIPEDGVYMSGGVLHIRGALYRRDQQVGAVNLRVGLVWTPEDGEEEDAVTLLNTQMVRVNTADMGVQDADDHCGFVAAVKLKRLPHRGENGQYRAVLVSEGRLIECDALGLTLRRQGESWTVEGGSR